MKKENFVFNGIPCLSFKVMSEDLVLHQTLFWALFIVNTGLFEKVFRVWNKIFNICESSNVIKERNFQP